MKLALLSLTFSTGLVDAASFLGLGHIFIANMTRNILFIGFSLAALGCRRQWQTLDRRRDAFR
jgi:uncharacterized membrane protein YoaK (UPF0700 family)